MSNLKLCILLCFSAAVGTMLFWVALFLWFSEPVSVMIESARAAFIERPESPLGYADAVMLGRLVDKGIVLDANSLMSQISSFYTTIITILITLLTILGISVPLYIKTNAETIATRQTKSEVIRYCRENNGFHVALRDAVDARTPSITESLRDILDVTDDLMNLQQRVDSIEPKVNDLNGVSSESIDEIKENIRNIISHVQTLDPLVDRVVQDDEGEGLLTDVVLDDSNIQSQNLHAVNDDDSQLNREDT
ncbi:hypothetical protein [Vibrio ostreae]|uniref:Uncharacterized protein n=1 Tax=Vibrio ostreae TaxID=2841925 RepID=A0A975U872_9VIBR|nr:hypothetical protein [Vibrio ostreae]QXO16993.1 hypothetical protein KNV97_16240 [Vibrio ostreae]